MTTSTFRETYEIDNPTAEPSTVEIQFSVKECLLAWRCYAYVNPETPAEKMVGSISWTRTTPSEDFRFDGRVEHMRGAFKATARLSAKLVELATAAYNKGLSPKLLQAKAEEMLEVGDAILIMGHLWPITRVTATRAIAAVTTNVQRRLSGPRDAGRTKTTNDSETRYPAYKKADNPDLEACLCHPQ